MIKTRKKAKKKEKKIEILLFNQYHILYFPLFFCIKDETLIAFVLAS